MCTGPRTARRSASLDATSPAATRYPAAVDTTRRPTPNRPTTLNAPTLDPTDDATASSNTTEPTTRADDLDCE